MGERAGVVEALQKAMQLEQDGQRFYLQAAERTLDPRGQEMFRSLADDEDIHFGMLQRQYEALTGGEGWVVLVDSPAGGLDLEEQLFPPDKEAMEAAIYADASDIDALHFALELENNAYQFYRRAARETAEPAGKAMYEGLASMEREHFNLLMANYEHMSTVGRWRGIEDAT